MISPCEPPIVLLPWNHFFFFFSVFKTCAPLLRWSPADAHLRDSSTYSDYDPFLLSSFLPTPLPLSTCTVSAAACKYMRLCCSPCDAWPNLHSRGRRCGTRPLSACHWHFSLFYSCDFSHFYIVMSLVLCNAVIFFVICPRTLSYIDFVFVLLIQAIIFMHSVAVWIDSSLSLLSLTFLFLRWFEKRDREATHVALVFKIIFIL